MRIPKTAALLIPCFLLASQGVFCQSKDLTKQSPEEIRKLVQVRPGLTVPEETIMKLVVKLIQDNASLTTDFAAGHYTDIADRLEMRGTSLLTHKFEKMSGKDSGGFWKNSAMGGATLAPVVAAIYITDAVKSQTIEACLPDEKTRALSVQRIKFDYMATVTQEFHVIHAGTAMSNATSCGGQVWRHQDTCVWE